MLLLFHGGRLFLIEYGCGNKFFLSLIINFSVLLNPCLETFTDFRCLEALVDLIIRLTFFI